MNKNLNYIAASDADLYDLLISGKQRLTEAVLHELARDRGIFYPATDTREDLANKLSALPHAFDDIAGVAEKRAPAHRREKTTSSKLIGEVTLDDLNNAAGEYLNKFSTTENVTFHPRGKAGFYLQVGYSEYNYSRTRLLQRERHEAGIEFTIVGGTVVIRRPATEKAKLIVDALKEIIESKKKRKLEEEVIELTGLTRPEQRSGFFTSLIKSIPGYKLKNVTSIKVSREITSTVTEDDLDIEVDESGIAEREMLAAIVHSMALSGHNLMQSKEFQDLSARGFFITAISWSSEAKGAQNDIIHFDAGFEDRQQGTGFKYSIVGTYRSKNGTHLKTMSHVSEINKVELYQLLESTARTVLAELLAEGIEAKADEVGAAE